MNGLTRHIRLQQRVMIAPIFAQLRRGPGDPTHRRVGDIYLRATRTPQGPALIKIIANGPEVAARAWGEGADWSLDQLPRLLGAGGASRTIPVAEFVTGDGRNCLAPGELLRSVHLPASATGHLRRRFPLAQAPHLAPDTARDEQSGQDKGMLEQRVMTSTKALCKDLRGSRSLRR